MKTKYLKVKLVWADEGKKLLGLLGILTICSHDIYGRQG